MLGFAFANPAIMLACLDYSAWVPKQMGAPTAEELAALAKFLKATKDDPRRKLVIVAGPNGGCETLRFFQANAAAAGLSLDGVVVGVADAAERLRELPGITIADGLVGPTGQVTNAKWDLDEVLTGAATGVLTGAPVKFVDGTAKLAPVMAAAKLPRQPKKKAEKSKAVAPAPPKRTAPRPDALGALFNQVLAGATTEKKQAKAAGWVAAQIEGLFDQAGWKTACDKMADYGIKVELVKAAVRLLKENGSLAKLRSAGLMDDLAAAATKYGVDVEDLEWLDARWPLRNMKSDTHQSA